MRGDNCCVEPVLGMTDFMISETSSSSGGSSRVDDDIANMISETISKNSIEQESLAFCLILKRTR